jgi:hypothetical protein
MLESKLGISFGTTGARSGCALLLSISFKTAACDAARLYVIVQPTGMLDGCNNSDEVHGTFGRPGAAPDHHVAKMLCQGK